MEGINGQTISRAGDAVGKTKGKGAGESIQERKVAVDWALSKEKWEEARKGTDEGGDGDVKMSGEGGAEGESATSSDDDREEDGENDEDEEESSEDDDEPDEPVKPKLPAVDVGSTLFVRNLPYETEEHELNTL